MKRMILALAVAASACSRSAGEAQQQTKELSEIFA